MLERVSRCVVEGPEIFLQPFLLAVLSDRLEFFHPDRRRSLCALLDFEADSITFRQSLETFALYSAVMNEDVLAAAFDRDESETLLIVEPLYGTLRHNF